jgi:2-amino-4-hydroxy-6-hydroxymethyldihydropteridine diphosphokinase
MTCKTGEPANTTMTEQVFIGLGSNLGDGRRILREAWSALGDLPGIELDGLSSPYLSAPVGMVSQHWFTNAVGRLRVTLAPLALLDHLFAVEAQFGRTRTGGGYADRTLDLDLLYFGDATSDSPELTLPHPRLRERLFVLAPLAELAPFFRDPISQKTMQHLHEQLQKRIVEGSSARQEIVRGEWEDGWEGAYGIEILRSRNKPAGTGEER